MNSKTQKLYPRSISTLKVCLITLSLSGIVSACSGGSLGEVDPLAPFIEARHKTDAAVRLIDKSFDKQRKKPDYQRGLMRYNKAYSSINTLIDQITLYIAAKAKLPEGISLNEPELSDNKKVIRKLIEQALDDAKDFHLYVDSQVCRRIIEPEVPDDKLCREIRQALLVQSGPEFINPIDPNTVFTSLLGFISSSEAIKQQRRVQLVDQINSLKLKPFDEIIDFSEKKSTKTVRKTTQEASKIKSELSEETSIETTR